MSLLAISRYARGPINRGPLAGHDHEMDRALRERELALAERDAARDREMLTYAKFLAAMFCCGVLGATLVFGLVTYWVVIPR